MTSLNFLLILALYLRIPSTHCLRILFATPCYHGHITPSGGVARALIGRGHQLDVYVLGDCCDSLVPQKFANVSTCFSKPYKYADTDKIATSTQLDGLLKLYEPWVDDSTIEMFHVMKKFLEERKDDYDVIVHDFFILGVNLAAKVVGKPVVVCYIGPASLFVPEEERYEGEPDGFFYMPESWMPEYVQYVVGVFSGFMFHHAISKEMYYFVRDVYNDYGLQPMIEEDENDVMLPVSFYYRHSILIHSGPPDVTLRKLSDLKLDNNFYHIGFIPDEKFFRTLPSEIDSFLGKSNKPVIYLSMGTAFEVEENKLQFLLNELAAQTDYAFIWSLSVKYDSIKIPENKGEDRETNLLLVSKIPQLTLLCREEVKVFITHAGANSMQEGIFGEKPMLVFPGFADQTQNARMLVKNSLALPLRELTYPEIRKKVGMVLELSMYWEMKANLKRSKQLMTSLGGFERAADIVEQSANGTLKVKPTPKLVNWCFDMHVLLLTIGLILSTVFALVIWSFFRLGKSVGLYFVGEREKTD